MAEMLIKPTTALTEIGPCARLVLQGSDKDALAVVATRFGVRLTAAMNRAEGRHDGRAALHLGPDEWWLFAAGEGADAVMSEVQGALTGLAASLVDISDRQLGYTLTGPGAGAALNAGLPLDLSLTAFPVGMATRTMFEKAEIMLWRTAHDSFHIEVRRSFAPYLTELLAMALAENAAAP